MKRQPFPDAPENSYVTPEGWLIVGDEAWTEEEWARRNKWEINWFRKHGREEATRG